MAIELPNWPQVNAETVCELAGNARTFASNVEGTHAKALAQHAQDVKAHAQNLTGNLAGLNFAS